MEDNLENDIAVEDIAKQAYMSVSNYYRMFFALIGCQVKEYLIKRRVSKAAYELKSGRNKVIDIAIKYSYSSPDAFTRTFKKITGFTPKAFAKGNNNYHFERINIMEKYFENNDQDSAEQYPDIKVISDLPDMRVAYYCYYGKNPEDGAFKVMKKWLQKNMSSLAKDNYRIFGYNAPDSDLNADEYGYEVCVTIPQDMVVEDELIKTKLLKGGTYAVVSIESNDDIGKSIITGWQRFGKWLEVSKYVYGEAQCLEEYLGFDKNMEHLDSVDLYMPVRLKSELEHTMDKLQDVVESISSFTVATYVAKGKGAEKNARKYLFKWAADNQLSLKDSRIFSSYNFEQIGKDDYSYKMFISIPDDMEINDDNITKERFPGGTYLRREVKYKVNGQSWYNFIKNIESNEEYTFGNQPFMEEYVISEPAINRDTLVIQHMPVNERIN